MLTKTAVFRNSQGGVSYIADVPEEFSHVPIEVHAEVSAPPGVPFWIIDTTELPGPEFRDAWEIDEQAMGEPAGVGGDRTRFNKYLDAMTGHPSTPEVA